MKRQIVRLERRVSICLTLMLEQLFAAVLVLWAMLCGAFPTWAAAVVGAVLLLAAANNCNLATDAEKRLYRIEKRVERSEARRGL